MPTGRKLTRTSQVDTRPTVDLGAQAKITKPSDTPVDAGEGRRRTAERVRHGDTLTDADAADVVRRDGWVRP
jgi:hypothetical protein